MNLLYLLIIHLVLLIPGYGLVKRWGLFDARKDIQLCMAYCASIAVLGLGGFALYVLDVPAKALAAALWLLVLWGTYCFVFNNNWRDLLPFRFLILLFVGMTFISTVFVSMSLPPSERKYVADPEFRGDRNYNTLNIKVLNISNTVANDNYIPYRQAQFFMNNLDPQNDSFIDEWGVTFFQRTVLMGSVVSSLFTMFGSDAPIGYIWALDSPDSENTYIKFQIIAHVLNAILIIPAFAILRRLFDKKVAIFSCVFIASSHFYLYNAYFSWPKSFVAFFILLSWALLLEKRSSYAFGAGVISGLAYLAHDLALLYVGVSGIYLLLKKRLKDLTLFIAGTLPFFAAWSVVSSVIYNKQSTFVYYPFALDGIPQEKDKATIVRDFFNTDPLRILKLKIKALLYISTPYQLFISEGQRLSLRMWGVGLYNIPGSLGLGLMIAFVAGLFLRARRMSKTFWWFALGPVLLCLIIFGYPRALGLGSLHYTEGLLVLLIGFSVSTLLSLKRRSSIAIVTAYVVNGIYFAYFALFSYGFPYGEWLRSPIDIASIAVIGGLFLVMGACLIQKPKGRLGTFTKLLGAEDITTSKTN